ncbi:MAG: GNAT family N-acetyltransferase [Gaiellaceae bacterium]
MNIRDSTLEDKQLLLMLVEEFEAELPPLPYAEDSPEEDWQRIEGRIQDGIVLIAEEGGEAVGFTEAEFAKGHVFVVDLYVREGARRHGVGASLLERIAEVARERGLTHMELHVEERNANAVRFYERLGFHDAAKVMRVALDDLHSSEPTGESIGAVHAQTDDVQAVERVVEQFLPRLARGATATVTGERSWTAVRVEPFDRDVLRKLGLELSYRFSVSVVLALEAGAVVRFVIHDQGRMVDEYLSIPEFYGPLPPGDVLALRANPTVVSRLTGAEPARVRAVARTVDSGAPLPPPRELYEQVAGVMGLEP